MPGQAHEAAGVGPDAAGYCRCIRGVARWSWREESGCSVGLEYDNAGPPYFAIVLAAYNDSGHSIFAIAEPGGWVVYEPDEVIC